MALRCIQCVFHRRAVDGNAMNHTLFQQCLYCSVKCNPVIHISHFDLDVAFRQGNLLVQKMLIIDMRWALFLSPFSLNISIALICPNLIEIAKIPNYLQDKST